MIAIACIQTITLLYIYLCVKGLDFRLNHINFHQPLLFIICINLNHHCHHYWTSESLLNLWEYIQGSNITNKWVVHFVIVTSLVIWLLYMITDYIWYSKCQTTEKITFWNYLMMIIFQSSLSILKVALGSINLVTWILCVQE